MASKEKNVTPRSSTSGMNELVKRFKTHPLMFLGTMIILVLVVVTFVFVPAAAPNMGPANEAVSFGTWNKKPIEFTYGSYMSRMRENRYNLYKMYGMEVGEQEALDIMYYAFQSTVVHNAILDELDASGFAVPKAIVDREIRKYPDFLVDGKLSAARLRAVSDADMLAIRKTISEDYAKNQYSAAFAGLQTPAAELDFVKSMAANRRYFQVAGLSLDAFPDENIRSWAELNRGKFATVSLSRISVASEKEAKDLRDTIESGTISFADAAKAHSSDRLKDQGGALGSRALYELEYEISDEAVRSGITAMAEGSISDPIENGTAWQLWRVDSALTELDLNAQGAFEKVKSYFQNYERGTIEDYFLAEANAFIAAAKTGDFMDAAFDAGMVREELGPVALNYGALSLFPGFEDTDTKLLASVSRNAEVLKAAFTLPLGAISNPFVIGQNVVVITPVREEAADSSSLEALANEYDSFEQGSADKRISSFFLESDKLDNKFFETYMATFR